MMPELSRCGVGARAAVEALLKITGGEVVLRLRPACADDDPPEEVVLKPCMLRTKANVAELLVSALAVKRAFGVVADGASLFPMTARVVAGETVWRVAGSSAVECGGAAVAWRLQLVR